jgi:hypothetical protein
LFRKCGSLDILKTYVPSRPILIALPLLFFKYLFQTKEDGRKGAYNTRVFRNTYTVFTGRPGGNGACVRAKRRVEINTEIVLKEMGCEDGDQWRRAVVNTVMDVHVS